MIPTGMDQGVDHMDQDVEQQIRAGLDRVRKRFLAQLVDQLGELDELWSEVKLDSDPDDHVLVASSHILHKISGAAGTLGLAELGDAARACETAILGHRRVDRPDDVQAIFRTLGIFAATAESVLAPQD